MEQDPKEVKIYKGGELVATARNVRKVKVRSGKSGEEIGWTCFHMPKVDLGRIQVFHILNGRPLSEVFNDSGVDMEGEQLEPVYYIHGLVETYRGNPSITSVVLGKPDEPINIKQFIPQLPDLYRRVAAAI